MPRRRLLLGSLAGLLLVGCGLTAATAAAGPNDPQLHAVAADVKMAKTLIVARRDLPSGFVDKGPQKNTGATPDLPCSEPDMHALVMTADVSSHDYTRTSSGSYAEVESEGAFFRSAADAEKMVGVMMNGKLGSCLKRGFDTGLTSSSKGAAKVVSSRLVPFSESVGNLHVRMWDIFVTFEARGLQFRDELVLGFYRRGRVVSSLLMDSLAGLTENDAKNISETLTLRLEALPSSAVL